MARERVWPQQKEGPTLTETEISNAGPAEVVDMLDTAKRFAEVAEKAERAGLGSHNRDVWRHTLGGARECAQRALLVMDILAQADKP